MTIQRKSKNIDGIDREILRCLYKAQRPLVSSKIAQCAGRTPSAISPRLRNLKSMGFIKNAKIQRDRVFDRKFGKRVVNIKAPRSIQWELDLIKSKPKR